MSWIKKARIPLAAGNEWDRDRKALRKARATIRDYEDALLRIAGYLPRNDRFPGTVAEDALRRNGRDPMRLACRMSRRTG